MAVWVSGARGERGAGTGRWSRIVGAAATLVVVSLLSGCWTQVGFGSAHRRYNDVESGLVRSNVASLTQTWSVPVPGEVSEPIVSAGRVYVTRAQSSPTATVGARALDVATGATVWDRPVVDELPFRSMLGVPSVLSNGEVWMGYTATRHPGPSPSDCEAGSFRLGAADGAVLGSSADYTVSPAVTAGGIVVQTERWWSSTALQPCGSSKETQLVVRDATTLAELWRTTVPGPSISHVLPAPTVANDRIIVASGSTLTAYPLGCGGSDCPWLWTKTFPQEIQTWTFADGGQNRIFVTMLHEVAVLNVVGTTLWRAQANAINGGIAVTADHLFVSAGTETEFALLVFPAGGCGSPTCAPTWSGSLGEGLTSAPVVAGGVAYVGIGDTLLAFDAAGCGASSCPPLLTRTVPTPARYLSVAQGRLFVAGPGGLTAYAPSAPSPG
jgi:outer membrane protein assembly factor BamB